MDMSPGTIVGDRYTVEERLGEGGMAVVYRVHHNELGTQHALKVLTSNSRVIRDRMLQEGRFQAKLQHPNIVTVTDVVAIHDSPALVMEYIDGPALDELLSQQRLTLDQADQIARGILSAVAHAHQLGVIHRDLKPANVLLEIVDQVPHPKVADFGLAKLLSGDGDPGKAATRTGSTMGTPQYMSPEQIKDTKNVDERSDVFAMGAILYELVTGNRAFDGENVLEIFTAVDSGTYLSLETARPDLPKHMRQAVESALLTDQEERTQSIRDLYRTWSKGEDLPTARASSLGSLPSLGSLETSTPIPPKPVSTEPSPATSESTPGGWSLTSMVMVSATTLTVVFSICTTFVVLFLLWMMQRPNPPVPQQTNIVKAPPVAPTGLTPDRGANEPQADTDLSDTDLSDTDLSDTDLSDTDDTDVADTDEPDSPPVGHGEPEVPDVDPTHLPTPPTPERPSPAPSMVNVWMEQIIAAPEKERAALYEALFRTLASEPNAPMSGSEFDVLIRNAPGRSMRSRVLQSYGRHGTDLNPLLPIVAASKSSLAKAGAKTYIEVAKRTNNQAAARELIRDQRDEIDGDVLASTLKALLD